MVDSQQCTIIERLLYRDGIDGVVESIPQHQRGGKSPYSVDDEGRDWNCADRLVVDRERTICWQGSTEVKCWPDAFKMHANPLLKPLKINLKFKNSIGQKSRKLRPLSDAPASFNLANVITDR